MKRAGKIPRLPLDIRISTNGRIPGRRVRLVHSHFLRIVAIKQRDAESGKMVGDPPLCEVSPPEVSSHFKVVQANSSPHPPSICLEFSLPAVDQPSTIRRLRPCRQEL